MLWLYVRTSIPNIPWNTSRRLKGRSVEATGLLILASKVLDGYLCSDFLFNFLYAGIPLLSFRINKALRLPYTSYIVYDSKRTLNQNKNKKRVPKSGGFSRYFTQPQPLAEH